jgi:cell wall assembly regulator SMI1
MTKRRRIIGTTPETIAAAEARLGRPLPPSFRDWLLEHNGSGFVFPVPDEREARTLTGNFFDQRAHLASYVADCLDTEPVKVGHLLPLAAVGNGDQWCLDLDAPDERGEVRVVRWSHETGRTWIVAQSFGAFVEAMAAGELED